MRIAGKRISDLVVVASHGKGYIDRCLKSLGNKYEVLVLDETCPLSYCGKYLWAYWHHKADNYFFMQDSMEALTEDYLEEFKSLQPERGCVAWAKFPMMWDSAQQKDWATHLYDQPAPAYGIFGPVFYVNRKTLDELSERKLLPPPPMNKSQAQGTERLWAYAFSGMDVEGPEWSVSQMQTGFHGFRKDWPNRN